MVASLLLGLGVTYTLADRSMGFGAVRSGPWVANLRASNDPDPYTKAHSAKSGEIALAITEGIRFKAMIADDGRPLSANCDYVIDGNTPQARFWSLEVANKRGGVVEGPMQRKSFTSSEITRDEQGKWKISVNRSMSSGNWIPLSNEESFELFLMLYEPTIYGGTTSIERDRLPFIKRGKCK